MKRSVPGLLGTYLAIPSSFFAITKQVSSGINGRISYGWIGCSFTREH